MLRALVLILALALVGSLFAADRPGHAAATVHTIVIDRMQYGAIPADVHPGDIIEWVNHDMFEHTVTARDGAFDIDLKPGASSRMTANAGTFAFSCRFHPGMTGTLVVKK